MPARGPDPSLESPDLAWATLIRAELDAQFPRPERLPERFRPRPRRSSAPYARARRSLAVAAVAAVIAGVATTVVARTPAPQVLALFLSSRSVSRPSASPTPTEATIGTGVVVLTPAPRASTSVPRGRPGPSTPPSAPTTSRQEAEAAPTPSLPPGPPAPAVEPSPGAPPAATPAPSPTPQRRLCLLVVCL